ncbi:hypothetical protein [Pseudorhodoferax sp.]|uniref:hypothetical protein n=1 Tax=Pseudorhodoferax sp. TaxID=1993553 RepID=UPI002DD62784|nr:hypothetical protein [Pseudorhodoferax sp.]
MHTNSFRSVMGRTIFISSIVLSILLSACGGGDDGGALEPIAAAPADEKIVVDSATGTVRFVVTSPTGELTSDSPLSDQDKSMLKASAAQVQAMTGQSSGREQAQAVNPSPCKTYRFSGVQGCLQPGPDIVAWSGASPADIAAVVDGCTQVTVGTVYSASTPPAGGRACFQYVVNASATVANQVILPLSITAATVELFAVLPNTLAFKAALAQSPSDPLNTSATGQYTRYVLMVRPADGPGGQNYSVGIGVPATPRPVVLNDDPSRPMVVAMNETKTGSIATTGQTDFYYFYPTTPGQTEAQFLPSFTANQTVTWRRASRSPAGVYSSLAEVVFGAGTTDQVQQLVPVTPTATGATTVNGVIIRVGRKAPYATTTQPFSIRVGVKTGYLSTFGVWNNEPLNRIYTVASGFEQAQNYIGVNLSVKDANGQPVKGEAVTVTVFQDENGSPSAPTIYGTTDMFGNYAVSPSLSGCPSAAQTYLNYVSSSPGDRWRMVGAMGKVVLDLPNAMPIAPNANGKTRTIKYFRVCSETYLGRS